MLGLLTVEESIGKKQRKLIQPAFTKANLSCWLIPFKTILAEKNIKTGKPMVFPVLMIWLFKLLSNQFSI
jgi:hypothetical protein